MRGAFDVLIHGAGVAGSVLAWLCARDGLRVALYDHGRGQLSGPFETVLAPTIASWRRLGLVPERLDGCDIDDLSHGSIWGSQELVWRRDEAPSLLLHRGRFDAALRALAAAHGAQLLTDRATLPTARHTVYATGRAARVAGLLPFEPVGPAMVALVLRGEPASSDRGQAVVEAHADGWSWCYVPSRGDAAVVVMCARAQYEAVATAPLVAAMLDGAHGPGGRLRSLRVVRANDATMRRRPVQYGAMPALVIGDAAATIDPLASQGVEKAVSAAVDAHAIVRGCADDVARWPRLVAMHARWEHDLQRAHAEVLLAHLAAETRFGSSPFWRTWSAHESAMATRGRLDPDLLLTPAAELRSAPSLLRHDDRYVEVPGVHGALPGDELARLGRVAVAPLLSLFEPPRTARAVLALAAQQPSLQTCSPRDVEVALQALWRRRWLLRAADDAALRQRSGRSGG